MNDRYNQLQANYFSVNNLKDSLTTSFNTIDTDYSNLKSNYNELNSNYNDLKSNYAHLNNSYINLSQEFTSLQTQYNSLSSKYDNLIMQPTITITDIVTVDAHTPFINFGGTQSVGASFNLVNSGQVDGFATVRLTGGGNNLGENVYFVPAGITVQKSFMIYVDSQDSYKIYVEIVNVKK